ncbi:MAG: MraY family glycosyltransferase [Pseudomonadota bacterium]
MLFETASHPVVDFYGDITALAESAVLVNPITLILPMIAALVISMVVIPVMVRLAPRLGLIDEPDPRKVHVQPVPRVGGFGIFLGSILPVVLLLPIDQTLAAYITGSIILFMFGVMDDSLELGHYVKFIGQFLAVIIVVYWGDAYVTRLPFLQNELLGETAGRLFTVFAMVGMINAINHSDGLDGLAGGEALLSLCCIAWLSYLADGASVALIALALVGGVLGFMRYNTYPAIIFMGDSGSQYLGFTLGFLAVLLTQQVNPALSPALPALILGLPIADIIAVFAQRIYQKMNWFRATRNHIHHRLLDLGFYHYESVVIIYSIQTLLVVCAVLLPYEADSVVLGLYLGIVAMIFVLLVLAERGGWRVHRMAGGLAATEPLQSGWLGSLPARVSYWTLVLGLSLFLVSGALIATEIPPDFTLLAMVMTGLMLVRLSVASMARFLPLRAICYMAIAFVVYLVNTYQPPYLSGADPVTYIFFGLMVAAIAFSIRFVERGSFRLTPTDFLVIIAIASLAILSGRGIVDSAITAITLKSIILFYGCELVLNRIRYRWNVFTISALLALVVISLRGMGLLSLHI